MEGGKMFKGILGQKSRPIDGRSHKIEYLPQHVVTESYAGAFLFAELERVRLLFYAVPNRISTGTFPIIDM